MLYANELVSWAVAPRCECWLRVTAPVTGDGRSDVVVVIKWRNMMVSGVALS